MVRNHTRGSGPLHWRVMSLLPASRLALPQRVRSIFRSEEPPSALRRLRERPIKKLDDRSAKPDGRFSRNTRVAAREYALAVEQSVEMPVAAISDPTVLDEIVGQVEDIRDLGDGRFEVRAGDRMTLPGVRIRPWRWGILFPQGTRPSGP